MERRNVLSVDDALRKEITELQEMLKLEREVRERGDREHKELREKYAEVVGKYGKLKGEFTTLLARTAEMHRDSEQSKAKLQKVETRLSEREQYLTEELRPKDVKMEEFCARLTEHKDAEKESRCFIARLEQTGEEPKRTVAMLREKNVKLKVELSTAEQEIKIRDTVERECRTKPATIPDVGSPVEQDEPSPKKRARVKNATDEEAESPKKSTAKKATSRPSAVSQRRDEEDEAEAEAEAKVKKRRKPKPSLVAVSSQTVITHHFLDWPPLGTAFAILDSKGRRQNSRTERVVDIVQAASDGPDRALAFYNFVCGIQERSNTKRNALANNETDREIIYYYVLCHYLLHRNDTTTANTLIGVWQKKLGHQILWEDFSREYTRRSPPTCPNEYISSRHPLRWIHAPGRTIPAPNPEEAKSLREKYPWYYGDSLTPQPSSDEDDTPPPITTTWLRKLPPPPIGNVLSHSNLGLPSRDPNGRSARDAGQAASHNYAS